MSPILRSIEAYLYPIDFDAEMILRNLPSTASAYLLTFLVPLPHKHADLLTIRSFLVIIHHILHLGDSVDTFLQQHLSQLLRYVPGQCGIELEDAASSLLPSSIPDS